MANLTLQKITPLGPDNTFGSELVVLASEVDGGETVLLAVPADIFKRWVQVHRAPTDSFESSDVSITFDDALEIDGL